MITPFVYDESLSIAQQIAKLFGNIRDLYCNKLSKDEFANFIVWLRRWIDDNQNWMDKTLKEFYNSIVDWLEANAGHEVCWDVTLGKFNTDVDAHRNIFNDLALHAITVDELANTEYDVDDLADCGLNVRGLAVYSWSLIPEYTPAGVKYDGSEPPASAQLTVRQLAEADIANGYFVEDNAGTNATVAELASAVMSDQHIMKE